MNVCDIRAQLAVALSQRDIAAGVLKYIPTRGWRIDDLALPSDYYLGQAQILLEQSYSNYKHPAGPNRDQRDVNNAIALLVLKGYNIIAPSDDPNFKIQGNLWAATSPADVLRPQSPEAGG